MRYFLSTPFKGNRHYIQGGDLFNAVQAVVETVEGIEGVFISKLAFTRFAYSQCELVIDSDPNEQKNQLMGEGELRLPDGSRKGFLLYEGKESPLERTAYDEEGMVESAAFKDQSATLKAPIQYSSIEAIIALTKVLNYRLAVPKAGKWIFGKIELSQPMPDIKQWLTITRTKTVPGRFSSNEINIDGAVVGVVQFIVGAP